jgi:hypothetical protein
MPSDMKSISSLWLSLGICGFLAVGLVPGAADDLTKTNAPGMDATTAVAKLQQQEIEVTAQFALLKELAAQHLQRADEANRTNQPVKAKWEGDLARELTDRVDRTAAHLEELMRQRFTAEEAAKASAAATTPETPDRDEAAFLARLDTQLWRVEQDIKAALETTRGFTAQLQTNTTPYQVLRVSYLVQENNTLIRFLERDRSDLELKALEYRALKKR